MSKPPSADDTTSLAPSRLLRALPRLTVVSRTLSDEAADEIRHRIEAGEFREGERMPSERELAEQLGISRTVLRESLRGLEAGGYVYAQAGRGRFVADSQDRHKGEALLTEWLRRHQTEFRDLVELRSVIEAQALRGAAVEPRELAAAATQLLNDQVQAMADGRSEDAAALDCDFHVLLTSHSLNRPLRALGIALIARASHAARAAYSMGAYQEESVHQHEAIVATLSAGNLAGAAELVADHHLSRADQIARQLTEPG